MKNNKLYTVNKWNKNLFDGGGFAGAGAGGSWDTETLQNVEGKNFNEAWDNAVKAGLKEFIFQGRRYNTKKENNPVREYNNRWVGASRRADVKNPSKAYDVQAGPIGGPLSLVPLVTDTYIGSPNRPPQLEYNPEAYDVYHHLNGMTTMSEKPRRITPVKSKDKNGNLFAYAGQMDNWTSLANADKSNNPWNYADDVDVTEQYMNSTGNNWFGLSKKDNPFSKGNMAGGLGAMAKTGIGKGILGAAGEIGYNLLSDGYKLDGVAGGIMNAAHAIKTGNPMIDTIKDTALGAVNHAIGTKTDQEALNAANSAIDYYSNYKGNAKSFDDIGPLQAMGNFKNPYKNGWVTSAADKKNAALERRFDEGKAFAENSQINNIYNIANDQIAGDLGNITALGGPLSSYDSNMGAIEYGLLLDERNRRAKKDQNNNDSIGSLFSMPSNAYALGGDVQMNGADFTTGLTSVNAGGSHEENPYDGVQMGVDPEGTPNLVEEGEVIYNDYVYSNRIELDEETKSKFKFPKKRDITYADAAKKLEKEVSERPNDPISQAAFKAQMESLAEQQERQKQEMEAQKAQEAFEALSPEEQVELMQYAQQQEQAEQETAMQEQAMAEQQAAQQQVSPEEQAMMQQIAAEQPATGQQEVVEGQPIMAKGGKLYFPGGDLNDTYYPNNTIGSGNYPEIEEHFTMDDFNKALAGQEEALANMNADTEDVFNREILRKVPKNLRKKMSVIQFLNSLGYKTVKDAEKAGWKPSDFGKYKNWNDISNTDMLPEDFDWSYDYDNRISDPTMRAAISLGYNPLMGTLQRHWYEGDSGNKVGWTQSVGKTRLNAEEFKEYADRYKNTLGWALKNGKIKAPKENETISMEDITKAMREAPDWKKTDNWLYSDIANQAKYLGMARGLNPDDDVKFVNKWSPYGSFTQNGDNWNFTLKNDLTNEQKQAFTDLFKKSRTDNMVGVMYNNFHDPGSRVRRYTIDENGNPVLLIDNDLSKYEQIGDYTWGDEKNDLNDQVLFYRSKESAANAGNGVGSDADKKEKDDYEIVPDLKNEKLRYAGIFGPAIGLGMQLAGIGRPDTSGLEAAANKASGPVAFAKWMPRGDFAVYKPDDPWFYTSPIMAQSNATQRSIANKSAVTKGAETLANNYATMIALGNAQRQQADNNYNKYMKAKEYNGNIYESNARRFDANSQFNAEAFNRNKQYAAQLNMQAAQAKMAADADWYNGIYGNVAGIFKGIGDIGRENAQHNMIARMAADGIFGTLDDQHIGHGYLKRVPKTGTAAKGGKLNKKRGGK